MQNEKIDNIDEEAKLAIKPSTRDLLRIPLNAQWIISR
jgi:hypothetical protein